MTHPVLDSEFHRIICSLNDEYHLGILQPPQAPTSSVVRGKKPRHHDEAYQIYEGLRVIYNQRRDAELLGRFRRKAEDISRAWVAKPRADPDLLPELSAPHGLQTDEERAALRRCLLELLGIVPSRPVKRLSDDRFDQTPRPKGRRKVISVDKNAIDDLPVRSTPTSTLRERGLHDRSNANSFIQSSASTSRVSLESRIFSTQGVNSTPATTQGTEYTSSRNGKRTSSFSSQFLDDDAAATGADLSLSESPPGAWDDAASDENRTIRGGSPHSAPAPLPIVDRVVPRSWSQSSAGSSNVITNEAFQDLGIDRPLSSDEPLLRDKSMDKSLHTAWPHFPSPYLVEAPLAVVWEVTRAALHCGVDLGYFDLTYDPKDAEEWHDQEKLRQKLSMHRLFQNKVLPERCDSTTWNAALRGFRHRDKVVVLSAELSYNSSEDGPLYKLGLKPMRLQLGHRLDRRLGPDRFIEITFPSPTQSGQQQPKRLKSWAGGSENIIRWLCDGVHALLGRQWKPFFTKPVKKVKKTIAPKDSNERDTTVFQEQVFFFATNGHSFRPPVSPGTLPSHEEAQSLECRTQMKLSDFLEWAINLRDSGDQPAMKLFSRISLSLTRTYETVVLNPSQILHREHDILSCPERGEQPRVMNDGMGRMSYGFAKQIARVLDLDYTPSAFQGRLGSAKGMWIRDVENDDSTDDIWIETYPSQRKFECPFIDIHHRTFEVKAFTKPLKSAALNRQFIPILETQAKGPEKKATMRQRIAAHLENTIREELATHLSALENQAEAFMFARQIRTGNSSTSADGAVPFLGGAPKTDADLASFLIGSGFLPKQNTLLDSTLWRMWESRIKSVKEKWNAEVPRSTHVYMGVDFTGVLKPGEVHLSFSSDFSVDGFSDTHLEGMDILVARAPAHFPSDIQKVQAVSHPKLRKLKDVILFPRTGPWPLADLLSGGDYDGDRAWVCWDPAIVDSFSSAAPCEPRDFIKMGHMRKRRETFNGIKASYEDMTVVCETFILSGMSFSMQPSLLGICTKFKEKLCYHKSVDDQRALILCDLVSNLVDQAKGGIEFDDNNWGRLCEELLGVRKYEYEQPEYEKEMSSAWRKRSPPHILDYLKFKVANDLIQECSTKLYDALSKTKPGHSDQHLTAMYRYYLNLGKGEKGSKSAREMIRALDKELSKLREDWNRLVDISASENWESRVQHIYGRWVNISPPENLKDASRIRELNDPWATDGRWSAPFSRWSELKASATFFNHYNSPTFAFRMAGIQLGRMKSMALDNAAESMGATAVSVRPTLWGVLKPDKRAIERLKRRAETWSNKVEALDDVTDYAEDGTVLDD